MATGEIQRSYCSICEEVTQHEDGRCVICREEEQVIVAHLTSAEVQWTHTKRKCLIIVTAVSGVLAINFALAKRYDGDDIVRSLLLSILVAIATWFATSLKSDVKDLIARNK